MTDESTPKRTGTARTYPRRIMLYENDEGVRLLEKLARMHGISESAVLRQLIRAAARQAGISASEDVTRRIKPGPKARKPDNSHDPP